VAAHAELGQAIGRDILRLLVRRAGGVSVLLPGARGFERRDHVIVNPSYYAFPAIRVLAREVPDPAWLRLAADGLGLLRRAQFGRWGLPPDWLALARSDGRASLAPGYPPRFSFDAVRVPLYLAWAGLAAEPAVAAAARFWGDSTHAQLPAWTDLVNNAVSPYPASAGIAAIARLAMRGREMQGGAARPVAAGAEPGLAAGLAGWLRSGSGAFGGAAGTLEYYSAALLILARFAGNDAMQQPT
jgi:endoglucanase